MGHPLGYIRDCSNISYLFFWSAVFNYIYIFHSMLIFCDFKSGFCCLINSLCFSDYLSACCVRDFTDLLTVLLHCINCKWKVFWILFRWYTLCTDSHMFRCCIMACFTELRPPATTPGSRRSRPMTGTRQTTSPSGRRAPSSCKTSLVSQWIDYFV